MFAVRSATALAQASIHTAGIRLDESTEPKSFVIRERGPTSRPSAPKRSWLSTRHSRSWGRRTSVRAGSSSAASSAE